MNKESKNLFQLYIALTLSILMNFMPSMILQVFGGLLFLVLFIALYIYRGRSEKLSMQYAHTAYLIKSIWIFTLILFIGIILALIFADHSVIYGLMSSIQHGQIPTQPLIIAVMYDYMRMNTLVFALTLLPSFGYIFYRLIRGMMALKCPDKYLPTGWV